MSWRTISTVKKIFEIELNHLLSRQDKVMRYNGGMNRPTKFVKTLSDEEQTKLLKSHQTSEKYRIRNRSQAILLSSERFSIDRIAEICRADRDTVSRWIDNWNNFGAGGLVDDEKTGRPPILTLEEAEKAIEIGLQNPKFPHRQLSKIKAETGKEISRLTLKNLLKKRLSLEENQVRIVEENG